MDVQTVTYFPCSILQTDAQTCSESRNRELADLIKEYDERFGHILGYRRMTSWTNYFNQTSYSKNRVHRIMKKIGIHSVIRKKNKKYLSTTAETTAENKLKRDFNATKPNEKWATDVTEFKIHETGKKLYLSAIIDLYDRTPVAYVISRRNDNKLVFDTYNKERPQERFHCKAPAQVRREVLSAENPIPYRIAENKPIITRPNGVRRSG